MTIFNFVTYITYLVPAVLSILILYAGTKTPFTALKFALLGYLTTSLLFYLLGEYLGRNYQNNLILIPIFGVIELGWFSFMYRLINANKYYYLISIPAFICLIYELSTINFHLPTQVESYTRFIANLSLFLLALRYCFMLLQQDWKNYNPAFFLLNSTLLLYAAFSCLYYLPLNLLINGRSENIFLFWFLNIMINLLFYIINTKVVCSTSGKEKIQL
ncbi:hypothetical protein [Myroides sp. DW712]|uniref:hypothetical protein n=1 Tax=Myroides sp. DW712 TaxID=3389800 RepID=UPI0039799D49